MGDACSLHGFLPCNGPVEQRILHVRELLLSLFAPCLHSPHSPGLAGSRLSLPQYGNAYLDADFPLLTRIISATIVRGSPGSNVLRICDPLPPPSPSSAPALSNGTILLVGAVVVWLCACWAVSLWLRSEAIQHQWRRRCGMLARRCESLFGVKRTGEHQATTLSSSTSTRAEGATLELASNDSAAQQRDLRFE